MEHRVAAIAVAGTIAGLLGIGAISLASAQTTTTTPPTTPSTTAPPQGGTNPNCHHGDGTPGTSRSTTDQTFGDPT
jgi:hypothetical protein